MRRGEGKMSRTGDGGEGRRWEGEERNGGQMADRGDEIEEKMRRGEEMKMDDLRW